MVAVVLVADISSIVADLIKLVKVFIRIVIKIMIDSLTHMMAFRRVDVPKILEIYVHKKARNF